MEGVDCDCRGSHRRGCPYFPHHSRNYDQSHSRQQPIIPPPHSHVHHHHQQPTMTSHVQRYLDMDMIEELAQSEHYSTLPPVAQPNPTNGTLRSVAVSTSSFSTNRTGSPSSSVGTRRIVDPVMGSEVKYSKSDGGCTPSTCAYLTVAFILVTIGASSGLYFGYATYASSRNSDRVFKVKFVITSGESYDPRFEMPTSDLFRDVSLKYQTRLNKIFNNSIGLNGVHHQRPSDKNSLQVTQAMGRLFRRSEILALERVKDGSDDVIVHANLNFRSSSNAEMTAADIYLALVNEISKGRNGLFPDVTIDQNSLDVTERREESMMAGRLSLPFYPTSNDPNGRLVSKSISNPSNDQSYFRSGYNYYRNPWEPRTRFPGVLEGLTTVPSPPIRRCQKIDLTFCSSILPYNETSYPNILGHWNSSSVEEDFVHFRQVVDAECYPMAREYVCRVLQPECQSDQLIYPCRDFCSDFKRSCGPWIDRLDDKRRALFDKMVKCPDFPRFDGDDGDDEVKSTNPTTARPFFNGNRVVFFDDDRNRESGLIRREKRRCRSKPGCPNELRMRGREGHICDSVIDCPDSSDEMTCDSCTSSLGQSPSLLAALTGSGSQAAKSASSQSFYCGSRQCVDIRRVCDSIVDCSNAADEENCLRLEPSVKSDPDFVLQPSGVVSTKIRGKEAKVCFEHFENSSIAIHRRSPHIEKSAAIICRSLGYREVIKADLKVDSDRRSLFVQVEEVIPTTSTSGSASHSLSQIIRQSEVACNSRQVLQVTCGSLECGRNPLFMPPDRRGDQELTSSVRKLYEQFDRPIDVLPGSVFGANEGDFPWVVTISRSNGQSVTCDGTLIDDQWVMTSTSCFEGDSGWSMRNWRVSLGSVRLTSKSPVFSQVKEIVALVHSPFNDRLDSRQTTYSGLSLVKLDNPANMSNYVRPSCVHSSQVTLTELRRLQNSDCFTTRWNLKKDRLEFFKVTIADDKDCDNLISGLTSSDSNSSTVTSRWKEATWCVRSPLSVPSSGHSGHSQVVDHVGRGLYCLTAYNTFSLVGIEDHFLPPTPTTTTSATSTSYHLFAKVTRHSEWIRQILDSFKVRTSGSMTNEVTANPPYTVHFGPRPEEMTSVRPQVVHHHQHHDFNWSPDSL